MTTTASETWYRGFVRGKTRAALAWIFAIVLVLAAREYPAWPGVMICLAGAAIRFWASGYLRKDTRPAVGGPYAWVRNPLYLGTYLMAIGTAAAIQNWILFAAASVCFAAVYHFIILDEEIKLRGIFGEPYLKYCAAVPRFFPRLWPAPPAQLSEINPEPSHLRFSGALAMKNKAYEAPLTFAALIGFVTLVAWMWKSF